MSSLSTKSLLSLPIEIQAEICQRLDIRSKTRLSMTCRDMQRYVLNMPNVINFLKISMTDSVFRIEIERSGCQREVIRFNIYLIEAKYFYLHSRDVALAFLRKILSGCKKPINEIYFCVDDVGELFDLPCMKNPKKLLISNYCNVTMRNLLAKVDVGQTDLALKTRNLEDETVFEDEHVKDLNYLQILGFSTISHFPNLFDHMPATVLIADIENPEQLAAEFLKKWSRQQVHERCHTLQLTHRSRSVSIYTIYTQTDASIWDSVVPETIPRELPGASRKHQIKQCDTDKYCEIETTANAIFLNVLP